MNKIINYARNRIFSFLRNKHCNQVVNTGLDLPDSVLKHCTGGWAITQEMAFLLKQYVIEHQCRNVIEFGAGSSSVVISHSLNANGGTLTSLEQNPEWCSEKWRVAQGFSNVECEMVNVTPEISWGWAGVYYSYDSQEKVANVMERKGPFDLAFVDAPQYFIGRDGTLPLVLKHLAPHAFIILDDAGRREEKWAVVQWVKTYPGLEVVCLDEDFGGKGVAILRNNWKGKKRVSLIPFLASVRRAHRRWKKGIGVGS